MGGGKEDQMGAEVLRFLAKARKVEKFPPEALVREVGDEEMEV